jgi:hypothetical protein
MVKLILMLSTAQNMNQSTINSQAIESIKTDARNWLAYYLSATPDRLPPADALVGAIALEQLAAEIRRQIADKIPSFDIRS